MFEICLVPASEPDPDGQRLGRITIDDFIEEFACYPRTTPVETYPRIWKEQLRLLVERQSAVALTL